jgi:hypothetical protein
MAERLVSLLADGDRQIDAIGRADNAPQAVDHIQRLKPRGDLAPLDLRREHETGVNRVR